MHRVYHWYDNRLYLVKAYQNWVWATRKLKSGGSRYLLRTDQGVWMEAAGGQVVACLGQDLDKFLVRKVG